MKRKHLKRVVAGAFAAVMATSGISFPQANVHAEEKGNEYRNRPGQNAHRLSAQRQGAPRRRRSSGGPV